MVEDRGALPAEDCRCGSCPMLTPAAAGGAACELRAVVIGSPDSSVCASHPALGPLRRPFPIGPVVGVTANGLVSLHRSPDTPVVRRQLLSAIDRIDVRGTRPLSWRDNWVVEQLRAMREPRAFHHIDRIEAAIAINRSRAGGDAAVSRIRSLLEREAPASGDGSGDFLTRFSPAGRLLLFTSVLVGGAAAAAALALEVGLLAAVGPASLPMHLGLAAGAGLFAAFVWLRAGLWLFRRAGIRFRAAVGPADGG